MMNSIYRILATAMIVSPFMMNGETSYTLSVKNQRVPSDVKAENLNGCKPLTDGYKRGWTADGWTAGNLGDRTNVLLSPTYHLTDEACENSLTLPALDIEGTEFLQWEIRSLLTYRPDSYRVEVKAENETVWKVIYSETDVKYEWSPRLLSLSDFAGKKLAIRFVCDSRVGYMLALDQVSVSAPRGMNLVCLENNTGHFFGNRGAASVDVPVSVTVLNAGTPVTEGSFVCRSSSGTELVTSLGKTWATGEERTLEFTLPVEGNGDSQYSVTYRNGSDVRVLAEGSVHTSYFVKRPFVDKGTGMWCNNCPEGTLIVDKLKKAYSNEISVVEAHYNDYISSDYFKYLQFRAIPWFMLDRVKSTSGSNTSKFESYLATASPEMEITISDVKIYNSESVDLTMTVTSAADIDNSSDRYRIGYVFVSDFPACEEPPYYQENMYNIVTMEQYYYLPSRIPWPLTHFYDVALGADTEMVDILAFEGASGSLPEKMTKDVPFSMSGSLTKPEMASSITDCRVICFVIDTASDYKIVNCAEASASVSDSMVTVVENHDTAVRKGTYRLDGTRVSDDLKSLPKGIYIKDGKKIVKL